MAEGWQPLPVRPLPLRRRRHRRLRPVQPCFNRRTRLESKTSSNTSFLFRSASRAVRVRCCRFFRKR